MARVVKSKFRAPRIFVVQHMSSVCALTEESAEMNTTISPAILAPTLPARLLQYPNVNSLASSPGRSNFSFEIAPHLVWDAKHAPGINERGGRADGTINMKVGEKPPLTALPRCNHV